MENTRLIRYLRMLTAGEFRRFQQFVHSPYFNSHEGLMVLLDEISLTAPAFKGALLSKQTLFQTLYGQEEPFDEQKLFNLFSLLQRLLYRFVAEEQFNRNEQVQAFQLLEGLDHREWEEAMQRIYEKNLQMHRQREGRGSDHYLIEYQLLDYGERMQRLQRRGTATDQLAWMHSLDAFYLTAKLRHSCEWLNRQNITQKVSEAQVELLGPLLQYLAESTPKWESVPSVLIYYQILLCLREPFNEAHFFALKKLLEQHIGKFAQEEQARMYAYAQNFCIQKINQGKPAYFEELFQIYEHLLENKVLLHNGILPHEHYKNITTVGLRLKKYAWVKNFLEENRKLLHPDFEENAYIYNLCAYYYEQGAFPNAMKLLGQVQFTDAFYDLSARSILLRIYYELEDDDSLKYHLEAFQAFLKRNKAASNVHIQSHQNLIRMTKKLVRLRRSKARQPETFSQKHSALQESLMEPGLAVSYLNWLQEQLAVLASS